MTKNFDSLNLHAFYFQSIINFPQIYKSSLCLAVLKPYQSGFKQNIVPFSCVLFILIFKLSNKCQTIMIVVIFI